MKVDFENKIFDSFEMNNQEKKLVDDILCDEMNLDRCEFIFDIMYSLHFDIDSFFGFIIYQLYKVQPDRAEQLVLKTNKEVKEIFESFKVIKDINHVSNSEEAEDIRKMFIALSKDLRVVIIKLAGILYDISKITPPMNEQQRRFVINVKEIFAPLAERLGLGEMKSTMEDHCFRCERPEIYEQLNNNIILKKEANDKQIAITKVKLEEILKELNIDGTITYRQKHMSSIFKKMQFKDITLGQIYDLIAMRVLVNSVEECYAVFGKIHSIYKPMQGRVKDYIANPKPNGYQSLHTTIIVENQRPMEIQIRTYEMHRNSEYGVAAHWIYKEKRLKTTALDRKMSWFREIMDNANNLPVQEFVETLKTDLYSGEIFVQTPKGKVLQFPEGATIIDFAYAIHSDIGNKCIGGKINDKMKPIVTKLKNGDVVEIITNPSSKGPSRDWLKIVRTSEARAKIRTFFKTELKDENIKKGKVILEQAIQEKGFVVGQVIASEAMTEILKKYAINDIEELYAGIGSESISVGQVVGRLTGIKRKQNKPIPSRVDSYTKKKNSQEIIVDGSEDMLIKYAGCCNPVFGDEIVGYISHGQGVTIHRASCPNVKFLEENRLIKAEWRPKNKGEFVCVIKMEMDKNPSYIGKITALLGELKIPLKAFESRVTPDYFICSLVVSVKSKEEIDKIINSLQSIKGVKKVYRNE